MLMDIALRQRLNVLFETTGSNITLTIQTVMAAKQLGYDIRIVYPWVSSETIVERVQKRNSKIGRAIPVHAVLSMVQESLNNFLQLLEYADGASVFDNNGVEDAPLHEIFSKIDVERQVPKLKTEVVDDEEEATSTQYVVDKYIRGVWVASHIYNCDPHLDKYPPLKHGLKPFCQQI
eukprot:TRINITY_DN3234_c0_g1_i2.p1 TRINITY_DN3234_c0_g1~~TRINITY_DN3234_c0_g1_i2.p1  ORF type:complete len:177 (+),score=1.15 TRINITY_DN3234_c0_g1_i2:107-637(+)